MLNALAHRIFEVLLQTGAVLGADGRSPVAALTYQTPSVGMRVLPSQALRVAPDGVRTGGWDWRVHGPASGTPLGGTVIPGVPLREAA